MNPPETGTDCKVFKVKNHECWLQVGGRGGGWVKKSQWMTQRAFQSFQDPENTACSANWNLGLQGCVELEVVGCCRGAVMNSSVDCETLQNLGKRLSASFECNGVPVSFSWLCGVSSFLSSLVWLFQLSSIRLVSNVNFSSDESP